MYANKREKFSMKTWKLFDELVRSECPEIPPEWRYELMENWDKTIASLFSRLDVIKKISP